MATASAWVLGEWSTMSEYVQMIPEDSVEGAIYRAVTAVQGERYPQARQVRPKKDHLVPTLFVCCLCTLLAPPPSADQHGPRHP